MVTMTNTYAYAAALDDLRGKGALAVNVDGHTLVLFDYGGRVYAVDNRCPHMGFPLDRGSVRDGILTCHWHHARFDLASGGTFDLWADDVRAFPVEVRDGGIWVNLAARHDGREHLRRRLRDGLERDLALVIAKSVIGLLESGEDPAEPFRIGLEFGTTYRVGGWGQGLTILTCMMNLLPALAPEERARALYHGLSAVAANTAGDPPRFMVTPLPNQNTEFDTLMTWFRQFVEVRDSEGAERCIVSAVRGGADHRQMAAMLFAAATDHRYIQIGHVLDFTNKALEALDSAGWQYAERALTSLARAYAEADRQEESSAWRYPIDLIKILDAAFAVLPDALAAGQAATGAWNGKTALVETLLGDNPQAIADALLEALRAGCAPDALASVVSHTAALRIARFHTSNEFGDWDTALHTFTFANAVQHGLRRVQSAELVRGVFDAAMSVYLDRFLNIPAAKLPGANGAVPQPAALLDDLNDLLNRQQQVNQAGGLVAQYMQASGDDAAMLAALGKLLLREDRDFHTIQCIEAAYQQYRLLRGTPEGTQVLVAAARYLAAHTPTMRAEGQTYQIALRLARGERLFEED
jgi:nitrite reductase/ring-hydroxylating ferredoxin subunit